MIPDAAISIERTSTLNNINRLFGFLGRIGIDPFKLNAEKLITKSKKAVKYDNALPKNLKVGIHQMIDSINAESQPNPFGKLAVSQLLQRTLKARLQVEQQLEQNKAIEQSSIKEPIFIIGMPRTGTTILHALMHEDSAHRSPLAWECLLPYPIPTPNTYTNNPSLDQITKEFNQLFKLVPDFKKKHHMEPDSPQECIGINSLDFNTFQISAQLFVPSYLDWFFNNADRSATMRWHKRFLQYLQSGGVKGKRWLLKSPVHLMRLPEIFKVYPDAKIIMTHRHPSKVVPSAASLISSVRSLYSDHEDPIRSGHEQTKLWSKFYNRFLSDRNKLNKENQIIDIKFEDFVNNQVEVVQSIYEHFNWNFSTETKKKMNVFIANNPKDKHGKHEYTLEQFGLSEVIIESDFAPYIEFLKTL